MDENDWKAEIRRRVWADLRRVARPDSRFHWDFNEFIPDFEGSERCAETIRGLDVYRDARYVFVTPDNGLGRVRQWCILDDKALLVSTYAIARGFLLVERGSVPPDEAAFASTLDGLDYVGQPVSIQDLRERGPLDLLITGASTISRQGVRFGKGHGYFDLEWGMFRELGLVDDRTPVVGVVHECQVVDVDLPSTDLDTMVDYIVTPTRVHVPERPGRKPAGIGWERLDPAVIDRIPPLQELRVLVEGAQPGTGGSR